MIRGNTAFLGGGGLYILGVSLLCTHCLFHSNEAQLYGLHEAHGEGGTKARSRALVVLRNSKITSCTAYRGGGMNLEDSALVATNLQVFGNHARQSGGAIEFQLGTHPTLGGPVVVEFHDCSIKPIHADGEGNSTWDCVLEYGRYLLCDKIGDCNAKLGPVMITGVVYVFIQET